MLFHKAREKGLARLLICRKELSISFVKICSINFVSLGLHSNAVVMFTPACPAAAAAAAGPLRVMSVYPLVSCGCCILYLSTVPGRIQDLDSEGPSRAPRGARI